MKIGKIANYGSLEPFVQGFKVTFLVGWRVFITWVSPKPQICQNLYGNTCLGRHWLRKHLAEFHPT